jgi:DNA-directed RNA polymerase specialized sigma24 family protein
MLKDEDDAEEMVQQVFFKLWERSESLSFSGSIAAYLYRAVHNESLNFLKHQKVKAGHQLHVAYSMKNKSEQAHGKVTSKELENKLSCLQIHDTDFQHHPPRRRYPDLRSLFCFFFPRPKASPILDE